MKKKILQLCLFCLLCIWENAIGQSFQWIATGSFPTPFAINIYCLDLNFGWDNEISVGGNASILHFPLYKSVDGGVTWSNKGPTPDGTVYGLAEDESNIPYQYAIIRDANLSPSGLYLYSKMDGGWILKACGGLDVRGVIDRYDFVLCGVRGSGKGIYAGSGGYSITQVYKKADIYCFYANLNTFWAGGNDSNGTGILLKSSSYYPYGNWTKVDSFSGKVIGITVTDSGNIFIATDKGLLYRSINNDLFKQCASGINFSEFKIPLACTQDGKIFYGDYQNGVYMSVDSGSNWVQINSGLANKHIVDIAVDPQNSQVYTALGGSLTSNIYKLKIITDITDNKADKFQNIDIFPNPTNGNIEIGTGQDGQIEILNIQNHIINSFEVIKPKTEIDLKGFPSGIYFVKFITNKRIYVKKFLKY